MRKLALFFYVAAMSSLAIGTCPAEPVPHSPATLRVGLWTLWHDKHLSVSPESGATLRLCPNCAPTTLNEPFEIRAEGDRLRTSDQREAATIFVDGASALSAHGEKLTLRSPLKITAHSGELVLAVTLPVESYVERVAASESGPADSLESLKALTVVVRSFALHQQHGHANYDLCDSTHCQLLHWAGGSGMQNAAHAATLQTAGETLWFHGQRTQAWFHQNCGGQTASPQEIWPAKNQGSKTMPWLASHADPWCTAGGAREWSADLSLGDLTAALANAGLAAPGWKTLTVAKRGESGRAVTLMVGSNQVSAEDFRLAIGRALGWNKILSTWFEIVPQGDHFVFHGRGSGHGVGLCQAGAAAMGAAGRNATQILAQYFPGANAADEATGRPWQSFTSGWLTLESLDPADAAFLPQLKQALQDAQNRAGALSHEAITVRAFRSASSFRDSTLAPGWVAAFTEGRWIATQPLETLASRKMLASTMRHEFLHTLIETQAAPATPLWLREGLVEALDASASPADAAPALKLEQVDHALSHATNEVESRAAHRAAQFYASRLLVRSGREQVLAWLRTGLPADALARLR